MKFLKPFFFLFPAILLVSCKKENMLDLVKGTGKIIIEQRNVPVVRNFHFRKGKMDVYFTQSSEFKVSIEAGEKLIDLIKIEVRNDTAFFTNDNKCNFSRSYKHPVKVHISAPDIHSLVQRNPGRIFSTNTLINDSIAVETWSGGDIELDVKTDFLWTHIHKTTSLTIRGSTYTHLGYLWHNSTFFGENLTTNYSYFFNNTTGNMYCHADSVLRSDILLHGDIFYTGNPSLDIKQAGGTGQVIRR